MKNLKKLVSVIVTVAMLISSFAAIGVSANGEYGDVAANNSYYKAIKVLSGLGVVKGDDEGNFNPTNDIKRSEMVTLVCRALGEESVALASGGASFDDVSANHWAAGYIAWGVAGGIVNGVGDNKFDPDAPVKFQDAVVMVLRALGYERIAQRAENGGYPTGYMKVASQKGVLAGTNFDGAKAATREVVAQVIYNALTTPLVELKAYVANPEDEEYIVYDGKAAELRTLLTEVNKIYKLKAEVLETAKTDVNLRKDAANPKAKLQFTGAYDYVLADLMAELEITATAGKYIATPYVGETEVGDYIGYTVEAYVVEDEDLGDLKLLAVVVDTKSVVTETIVTADVTSINYDNTTGAFTYYANEAASKTTKIDVDYANLVVYYNGAVIYDPNATPAIDDTAAVATDVEDLLETKANIITFLGKKNADYNKIFVTDYSYEIVDDVNVEEKYIVTEGSGLDLDAESRGQEETFVCNIYDADGNKIDIADIKEDDVLNIVAPLVGGLYDLDLVETIDIYVTDNTVEGAATEEIVAGIGGKYVIDGDVYKTLTSITTGDEGIFYLTIDNLVLKADTTSAVSNDYAFIVNGEDKTSFGEGTHYVQLFTAEGKLETYTVASQVKVTGVYGANGDGTKPDGDDVDTLPDVDTAYATHTYKRTDGTQDTFFGTQASPVGTFDALYADQATEALAKTALKDRIITYKLNAAGEINAITFAKAGEKLEVTPDSAAKYYADTEVFANYDLGTDSKLFVAPVKLIGSTYNVDKDDLKMASFDALDEDKVGGYYTFAYAIDNADYLGAAIVAEEISSAIKTTHLAVVKSKSTGLDAEQNTNVKYTFVQSGEVVTLAVDNEADAKVTSDELAMTAGDIFRYTVNGDGEIDNIQLIYDASAELDSAGTGFKAGAAIDDVTYTYTNLDTNDIAIVYGNIAEIRDGKMTVSATYDDDANPDTAEVSVAGASTGIPMLKFNTTEGNTYASVDEAIIQTAAPQNGVKALSGYGNLRASVAGTAKNYFVVAVIGENNRFEDCVMIIK